MFKVFSKRLTPREQRKLVLTYFNLGNIFPSLALETGSANNNLIIQSTSFEPLPLTTVNILPHVTKYETPARKRAFFAYSPDSYYCLKRSGIDTFTPASFNGITNCWHMEGNISSSNSSSFYKLFYIKCFFFVCVWWCKNEWFSIIFL